MIKKSLLCVAVAAVGVLGIATVLTGIVGCTSRTHHANAFSGGHNYLVTSGVEVNMILHTLASSRAVSEEGFISFELPPGFNTEEYKTFDENRFLAVAAHSLSTFGADVDTASYSNVRRMIMRENRRPPKDAVRIEEFINYFSYNYPQPEGDASFSATFEMGQCPWNPAHQLLLIGIQGKSIPLDDLPPSNFVFLLDNSGSMSGEMPLLRESMTLLAGKLRPQDKLSIVTYAGDVKILLDSVGGSEQKKIKSVISGLTSKGFTPGGQGIVTAYDLAVKNFIKGGNNRVILVTDGDFNVGVSSESELISLIEKKRDTGVYLTTIGMGAGNYKDNKMKMLANKGNGNYIYLDSIREARNALVNEMTGRMYTLAKDVKFQLEFNPAHVFGYRLIGYELRKLRYQEPEGDAPSRLLTFVLPAPPPQTANWNWASAVAEFALLLRDSAFKGAADFDTLRERAQHNLGTDPEGNRSEFLTLVATAKRL